MLVGTKNAGELAAGRRVADPAIHTAKERWQTLQAVVVIDTSSYFLWIYHETTQSRDQLGVACHDRIAVFQPPELLALFPHVVKLLLACALQ